MHPACREDDTGRQHTESRQALQQMRAMSVLLPELASRLELMRLPLKRAFCGEQIWDRNSSVGVRLPLLQIKIKHPAQHICSRASSS